MYVIRLEYEDATGVYGGEWRCPAEDISGRHPMPYNDSAYQANSQEHEQPSEHYCFGFASYEQFRHWFYNDAWLKEASEYGVMLSIYSVPETDIIVGHTQCTFDRDTSKLIWQDKAKKWKACCNFLLKSACQGQKL